MVWKLVQIFTDKPVSRPYHSAHRSVGAKRNPYFPSAETKNASNKGPYTFHHPLPVYKNDSPNSSLNAS